MLPGPRSVSPAEDSAGNAKSMIGGNGDAVYAFHGPGATFTGGRKTEVDEDEKKDTEQDQSNDSDLDDASSSDEAALRMVQDFQDLQREGFALGQELGQLLHEYLELASQLARYHPVITAQAGKAHNVRREDESDDNEDDDEYEYESDEEEEEEGSDEAMDEDDWEDKEDMESRNRLSVEDDKVEEEET